MSLKAQKSSKWLVETNTLAYYVVVSIKVVKHLTIQAQEQFIIKIAFSFSANYLNKQKFFFLSIRKRQSEREELFSPFVLGAVLEMFSFLSLYQKF